MHTAGPGPVKPRRERFRVTLEATDATVPAAVALKLALKRFWRSYGLRALSVEQLNDAPQETTP